MRTLQSICLFGVVSLFGPSAFAEEANDRKSIKTTKELLSGTWLLFDGQEHAVSEKKTVWKISASGEIKDSSSPERDIRYKLVGTEEGNVWMMILPYGPGSSGPMVMSVTVDKSTLTLNYVDIGPDGNYGPLKSGGLKFQKEIKGETGADQPAASSESKPKGHEKPQPESKVAPR